MLNCNDLLRSSPERQGIQSASILSFLEAIKHNQLDLHSFMLLRRGNVVAEGWWGPFAAHYPHMVYSITKSFVSTAVGLAADQGLLSIDNHVLDYLPDQVKEETRKKLESLQIRHLLTMSSGHTEKLIHRKTDCEILPVDGTIRRLGPNDDGDWLKGFLEAPLQGEPGSGFFYDDGVSYMLSFIIQKATGQTTLDFLNDHLFTPLGIHKPHWDTCPKGVNIGGWGLRLRTEDIARFGQLFLQEGIWNGRRILSRSWIEASTARQIDSASVNRHIPHFDHTDWEYGYGYQFWRFRNQGFFAFGAAGQFCIVLPGQEVVLAVTGGFYAADKLLNLAQRHLFSGILDDPLPLDDTAYWLLEQRTAALKLEMPDKLQQNEWTGKVNGKDYKMKRNADRVKSISLEFNEQVCALVWRDHKGEHKLVCGLGTWFKGDNVFLGEIVAANGGWENEQTFVIELCFLQTPYYDKISFHYEENKLNLSYSRKITCCSRDPIHMCGSTD